MRVQPMPTITVSYDPKNGVYRAKAFGCDNFAEGNSKQSARRQLERELRQSERIIPSRFARRESICEMSLRSRFIKRRT